MRPQWLTRVYKSQPSSPRPIGNPCCENISSIHPSRPNVKSNSHTTSLKMHHVVSICSGKSLHADERKYVAYGGRHAGAAWIVCLESCDSKISCLILLPRSTKGRNTSVLSILCSWVARESEQRRSAIDCDMVVYNEGVCHTKHLPRAGHDRYKTPTVAHSSRQRIKRIYK
jgi:hypothetical protein